MVKTEQERAPVVVVGEGVPKLKLRFLPPPPLPRLSLFNGFRREENCLARDFGPTVSLEREAFFFFFSFEHVFMRLARETLFYSALEEDLAPLRLSGRKSIQTTVSLLFPFPRRAD